MTECYYVDHAEQSRLLGVDLPSVYAFRKAQGDSAGKRE